MTRESTLPPPVIREHDGILVVRDDMIAGGSKRRALPAVMGDADEYVYASPAHGYAQVSLAVEAKSRGARCTIFVAARKTLTQRTEQARAAGAKIVQVPAGRLNVTTARATAYANQVGARILPFGLDTPAFIDAFADTARRIDIDPPEVWTVAGSGTLTRALQHAWPAARFRAVRIGRRPAVGRALMYTAPERFEESATEPPPFPSCDNYDAKAWRFIRAHAIPGALFWNVAA